MTYIIEGQHSNEPWVELARLVSGDDALATFRAICQAGRNGRLRLFTDDDRSSIWEWPRDAVALGMRAR